MGDRAAPLRHLGEPPNPPTVRLDPLSKEDPGENKRHDATQKQGRGRFLPNILLLPIRLRPAGNRMSNGKRNTKQQQILLFDSKLVLIFTLYPAGNT